MRIFFNHDLVSPVALFIYLLMLHNCLTMTQSSFTVDFLKQDKTCQVIIIDKSPVWNENYSPGQGW